MKVLIPNTKDFSKEAIVKFLNIISDEKVEVVLKGVQAVKAANTPYCTGNSGSRWTATTYEGRI
ncbi:hypothetical protein RHHCN13_07320 [Rickettsia conorii subsp. heilongjiangensis]|uniref:Uncharacterized protein n=2 Tax=Rickettsia conorii TaxID=781 RepID=A0AAD1LSE5_RICCR|nr:hypothetical protein [Rickettsia conorii]BBM91083.1 hypothetical protein RHCH81_07320 [Rickettsia conorii subsp. heilongjiangensis]BBM92292.1 hypothetical protein RHHCN13_07320 [Rickettsia conorii subsp. heilongjiangensis]BBM93501.1 hypothetical protein RHSENDAI29_07320 [Rickettsia conorii subsp. heilongjiangensis]BBM94710.1 hypothetical protein RHSENDAI58_07320 [Rickettsia conorii subsp. heilongjiangensis]